MEVDDLVHLVHPKLGGFLEEEQASAEVEVWHFGELVHHCQDGHEPVGLKWFYYEIWGDDSPEVRWSLERLQQAEEFVVRCLEVGTRITRGHKACTVACM
ncbi:unnamed protein product [Caretta caretta]